MISVFIPIILYYIKISQIVKMKVDKTIISEICKVGLGIALGYATLKCITYAGRKQSEN